tara:strand:+ start:3254 stop:3427 length:174 start_codon:yes stop_codon:yes gene_type:complete
MDPFDPAINYGPNDAGVSALSITFVIIGIIASTWAISAVYSYISDLLESKKRDKDQK